jgi:hypothetical protein
MGSGAGVVSWSDLGGGLGIRLEIERLEMISEGLFPVPVGRNSKSGSLVIYCIHVILVVLRVSLTLSITINSSRTTLHGRPSTERSRFVSRYEARQEQLTQSPSYSTCANFRNVRRALKILW